MPIRYTDEKLIAAAEYRFRKMDEGESMADFRAAFAGEVQTKDPVDAHEIRTGTPWDEWTRGQFGDFLRIGNNSVYAMTNFGMLSLFAKFANGDPDEME